MPANPKYLTKSLGPRITKISAAILGGFLVTASFHLMWASFVADRKSVWATYSFTIFLMWCALMLVAFLFKSGWKCWALYGGVSLLFSVITFLQITD